MEKKGFDPHIYSHYQGREVHGRRQYGAHGFLIPVFFREQPDTFKEVGQAGPGADFGAFKPGKVFGISENRLSNVGRIVGNEDEFASKSFGFESQREGSEKNVRIEPFDDFFLAFQVACGVPVIFGQGACGEPGSVKAQGQRVGRPIGGPAFKDRGYSFQ